MRSELLRAPSLTKSSVEHHTILIIEDDKGLNKLIAKHLRREGFETHSAFTGGETLSTLKQNQNMILLMDYKLPDMTATEVLGKLADWKWMGPFLIMTGHGDEQIAVELMKQGAIDYIVKDTNFLEAIPQKIKRACNIIEQQQKLARAEEEISRLASFPEINPNPVLQIELSGRLRYINPAAQTAFPEISEKGLNHPFLKGLSEMLVSLRRKHEEIVTREIHVGKEWYHQTISYISNIHCIHIYSLNITNIKQMQEQLISSLQEKEILFRELYAQSESPLY
jgi:FixJ family two-component response regulator